MKIAVFPGSFDPITLGHVDVIKRAVPLFDEIIVAIGNNSQKKYLFSLKQRTEMLERVFKNEPSISYQAFSGLTVDFCREMNAEYIVRGLRSIKDFEYEKAIAQMNKGLAPDIETIFVATSSEYAAISSTIVREILANGGNVDAFVPEEILSICRHESLENKIKG